MGSRLTPTEFQEVVRNFFEVWNDKRSMHKSALAFGALLVFVLTAAIAQPAYGHAVFINGYAAYTVNTTQTLTMNVPNERDDTDYNVDIKVAIPAGWQALSCVPNATWSCTSAITRTRCIRAASCAPAIAR